MGKKTKKNASIFDVYEAADQEEEEKKILARRGGGGGSVGRTMDQVANLDFSINEIDADDDEEIDEDEAFNESDEERYGAFFETKDSRSQGMESDEEDQSEEEGMIDISDMLNDDPLGNDLAFKNLLPAEESSDEESQNDSELSQLEAMSDDESQKDSESDEPEQQSYVKEDQLVDFIKSLEDKKLAKKRKRISEVTEAYDESEYALGSRQKRALEEEGAGAPSALNRKLQLQDMMNSISDETSFGGLKKQIERLEHSKDSEKIVSALSAPLPKRIQDRYHREAAYEEAKKDISKWAPIIKKNRESDQLSFPMNEPVPTNMSSGAMVGQFEAATDMEKEIQRLLEDAAMTEQKIRESEELELNKISKEELIERRAELSKMRALLFFKEQKQKKIAKIKSKVYRKLHKKPKGDSQLDLDIEELKKLDPEMAKERLAKLEAERARERVTLKHKNTSKWAKQMLNRKDGDVETRRALMAQLDKHQELKKKIQGYGSDDSDAPDTNEEDVMIQLNRLQEEIDDESANPQKGLMAMKFMKKSLDKQKQQVHQMVERTRNRIERDDFEPSDEEDKEAADQEFSGRRAFGPDDQKDEAESYSEEDDDEEYVAQDSTLDIKSSGPVTVGESKRLKPLFKVEPFQVSEAKEISFDGSVNAAYQAPPPAESSTEDDSQSEDDESDTMIYEQQLSDSDEETAVNMNSESEAQSNPWLSMETTGPLEKSLKVPKTGALSTQDKAINKFMKSKKKILDQQPAELDDVKVNTLQDKLITETPASEEVEEEEPMTVEKEQTLKISVYESSDDDSDFEENPAKGFQMINAADIKKMSHVDIMRMTFENDDIANDFEIEKGKVIERDMPKEEDLTLPGWGTWGGTGLKAPKTKKVVKNVPGIELEKRQDAKLSHVIINEKRPKKAIQYMVPQVPHGFENRDQYERVIRMPLGKEWNAQGVHRERIKPKVVTKLGTVINPLTFISNPKSAKAKAKSVRSNKRL